MTTSQLYRTSGLSLVIGAFAFVAHVVLRSLFTAGVDPLIFAKQGFWVPTNALGFAGAMLVLMGLPGMYARMAMQTGRFGLVGVVLIAIAWTFFGVFLSLYAALVLPWLANEAPALVGTGAPLPAAFIVAFIAGLIAWLAGTVLLAIPFIRGRVQPRWVGYLLPVSGIWVAVGSFVIAPGGPATNPAVNLLSNLGPVLLLVAIGHLGARPWTERVRKPEVGVHGAIR